MASFTAAPSSTIPNTYNLMSAAGSAAPATTRLTSGSTTMTITSPEAPVAAAEPLILSLEPPPRVTWEAEVINNEGLGRKSSKRCCIYKKPSMWNETSSDESADDGRMAGGEGAMPIARKKGVDDTQRYHA